MIRKMTLIRLPGVTARQEGFPFSKSLIKPPPDPTKVSCVQVQVGIVELMRYADVDGMNACGRPQRGLHNQMV